MNGNPENTTVTLGQYQWDGPDGAMLRAALDKSAATGKGILFAGVAGSGKTTAANFLAASGYAIACYDPEKVESLRAWRGWALPDKTILLDELGRDNVRNEFGSRVDIVANFIRDLYASWKKAEWRGKLYVTTNAGENDLVALYDASLVARIREMCAVCRFDVDRRKMARNAPAPYMEAEARTADARRADPADPAEEDWVADGIDLEGPAFAAAMNLKSRADCMMATLRILRVNMSAFDGGDCVKLHGVWLGACSETLLKLVHNLLVYAFCGHEKCIRYADRLKSYASKVFAAEEKAQRWATQENLAAFGSWCVPYDIEGDIEWKRQQLKAHPGAGFMRRYLETGRAVAQETETADSASASAPAGSAWAASVQGALSGVAGAGQSGGMTRAEMVERNRREEAEFNARFPADASNPFDIARMGKLIADRDGGAVSPRPPAPRASFRKAVRRA